MTTAKIRVRERERGEHDYNDEDPNRPNQSNEIEVVFVTDRAVQYVRKMVVVSFYSRTNSCFLRVIRRD